MFSSAPNRFGDEPNTNVDPVTLGHIDIFHEPVIALEQRSARVAGLNRAPGTAQHILRHCTKHDE